MAGLGRRAGVAEPPVRPLRCTFFAEAAPATLCPAAPACLLAFQPAAHLATSVRLPNQTWARVLGDACKPSRTGGLVNSAVFQLPGPSSLLGSSARPALARCLYQPSSDLTSA